MTVRTCEFPKGEQHRSLTSDAASVDRSRLCAQGSLVSENDYEELLYDVMCMYAKTRLLKLEIGECAAHTLVVY